MLKCSQDLNSYFTVLVTQTTRASGPHFVTGEELGFGASENKIRITHGVTLGNLLKLTRPVFSCLDGDRNNSHLMGYDKEEI